METVGRPVVVVAQDRKDLADVGERGAQFIGSLLNDSHNICNGSWTILCKRVAHLPGQIRCTPPTRQSCSLLVLACNNGYEHHHYMKIQLSILPAIVVMVSGKWGVLSPLQKINCGDELIVFACDREFLTKACKNVKELGHFLFSRGYKGDIHQPTSGDMTS